MTYKYQDGEFEDFIWQILVNKVLILDKINMTIDEEAKEYPIVTKVEKGVNLNSIMSNSFGFGGTNATLVFEKIN